MESIKSKFLKKQKSFRVFVGILSFSLFLVFIIWIATRGKETTDDSQVTGHIVTVSPRIAGQVVKVYVDNHQNVKVGDPIVELDNAQQLADVNSAQAEFDATKASYEQAQAQHAQIDKNYSASLTQAKGGLTQASSGVVASLEAVKQARANLNSAKSAAELAKKI